MGKLEKHYTRLACAEPAERAPARKVPTEHVGVAFIHRWPDVVEFGDESVFEPVD